MKKIIGYGEDSLTFYFLKEKRRKLINQIKKKFSIRSFGSDYEVFYRLSFGRKWIGEFDAVIVSPGVVFLIESKWGEKAPKQIKLDVEQWSRHKFVEQAIKSRKTNWSEIKKTLKKTIKTDVNILSTNLNMFFKKCEKYKVEQVKHILLFFKTKKSAESECDWLEAKPYCKELTKGKLGKFNWIDPEKPEFEKIVMNAPSPKPFPTGFVKL